MAEGRYAKASVEEKRRKNNARVSQSRLCGRENVEGKISRGKESYKGRNAKKKKECRG